MADRVPQLPGGDAAPLAELGGGRPQLPGAPKPPRPEWVTASISVAVMLVITVAVYVAVQTVALRAKREYGDDAFGPVWMMGMGVATLLGTLWFRRSVQHSVRKLAERLDRSILTDATVTDVKTRGKKGSDGYSETPVLRFVAPGAGLVEHESAFHEMGFEPGQTVAVRVDPADPSWVAVDAHDHAKDERFMRRLVLGSLAAGATSIVAGGVLLALG